LNQTGQNQRTERVNHYITDGTIAVANLVADRVR
jgi:hypothetical protein